MSVTSYSFSGRSVDQLASLQVGPLGGHKVSCCREDSFRGDTCDGNGQVHLCQSSQWLKARHVHLPPNQSIVFHLEIWFFSEPFNFFNGQLIRALGGLHVCDIIIRLSEECPAGTLVFLWLSRRRATDPLSQIPRGFPLLQGSQPVAEVV